jgi:crotonobetainyl-CoA:carnitine CoA-transferase CaiB-like acyl-CoA transferase
VPQATRALEGVRVIDLTRTTAGLYGVTILADMGADVIKIEPREITPRTLGRLSHPPTGQWRIPERPQLGSSSGQRLAAERKQ